MNVWEKVLELLFPRRCPFCGKVTGGVLLCDDCKSNLPVTDLQPVRDLTFARCAAPLYYEQSVRDALLDFKFHSRTGGLDCFGDLLAQCAAACFAGEFDTISWVPVSDKRRRQRGFDQSYELSCAVCHSGVTKDGRRSQVRTMRANRIGIYGRAQWATDLPFIEEPFVRKNTEGKVELCRRAALEGSNCVYWAFAHDVKPARMARGAAPDRCAACHSIKSDFFDGYDELRGIGSRSFSLSL